MREEKYQKFDVTPIRIYGQDLCYNLWHKSAPKSVKDVNTPAQSIKLGLSKEVVTVVADPVESREDGGVIDALALEVEE